MDIFERLSGLGFGELHFGHDPKTGLKAIAAIHSNRLGPAIGGCRVRAYPTQADAIEDVTNLARGMTYKAALARLPHGGGKSIIFAPDGYGTPAHSPQARADLFRAFGRFIDGLGGRYITAEDSGTGQADMDVIHTVTKHVLGISPEQGGSGDPSPFTALGVRRGIEAVAQNFLGKPDLKGMHIAVQGVGHVGTYLARELHAAGAQLTISDVDPQRRAAIAKELGARAVDPAGILEVECDIVAPCALGGAMTEELAAKLKAKAVAGAANNQLKVPSVGRTLFARGIFYAPDYVINAGGLISVAGEYARSGKDDATKKTMAIYDTIKSIIERSKRENTPPEVVADRMAEEIINTGPAASATPR